MGDIQFKLPFQIGNNYFQMTETNKEKIKENLIFIFTTDIGERVVNSNIGSRFRRLLFENSSDINKKIENEINRIFSDYFPELILENVNFKIKENSKFTNNYLQIVLEYSIKNIEDSKEKLSLIIG